MKIRDRRDRRGSDSENSDGGRSDSSDSGGGHWNSRHVSENDGRDKDRERRRGSERREREQPRRRVEEEGDGNRKRRDERERNERGGSDSENSDKERDRKKSERREEPRRRVEEDGDGNRKRRDERGGNGRGGSDLESSVKERDRKRRSDLEGSDNERDRKRSERREREQPRKRSDVEEDGDEEIKRKRDSREKNWHRENDSESSGDERDRKRSEKGEQEKPRERLDDEEAGDGKRSDNKGRNGRQENDSGNSDEKRDRKKSEKREKEQHRKRLDDKEKDEKEIVIEGRHGRRRNERNSRIGRQGSDSESSGGDRRRDRERRRRERERRKHRYDSDDSSDSDGRRKRHSMRRSDRREDRTSKQTHDFEEGEIRSRWERNEKVFESKQEGKNVIGEEPAKPQTQSTATNMNPGGDLSTLGRTGGVYIPPFKLARMMKEIEDKSSVEYQRLTWDALRKSINGLVNKVNAINIKNIIPELLGENLIRGRGLFCRSCMKSQMASPGFTDVFAALVAVVNTKFPEIGDLLLRRIILQLKRAYKRNDKPQLMAAVKFIAHLVNQQVAHELVALELLTILLEQPTDDSVEVAVDFVKECGSILQDLCPKGLHGIFERFRGILHEGEIDKRVQFLIEGLFAIRKAKFQGHPAVRPELDLVDPEDQLTHEMSLEDEIDPETGLDFEEAGHKLLKIKLEPGQEMELNIMLLECCSQERTYLRYYGLLGQRFCMLNKVYQENFDRCFVQQYSMIHRLETNKLRNVAKFFAHLLGTDALPWHVLAYIRLTEEDTTSSSRIFIKILFQELSEHLGIRLLNERLNDPAMQDSFDSIFPKDNPRNTRFAINFFTSIGLGGITENLREYLKNMPRLIMQQQNSEPEVPEDESDSGSGSGSSSSSSGSESSSAESDSSSDASSSSSDDDRRNKRKKNDSGGGRHRKRRKGD
uniref:MI domain-containing protein n=1 Tax=Chenopodium quinoa TaxID=63459 RepID=A0A803MW77_CHEQI